jgi:tetratricopeptide (TPR) repeat protein
MTLLKAADNVEDAMIIRDTIKLFGKAHPNIQLRSQLQYGIDLMVADNCEKARKILLSMVTNVDPTYIDAWNYLANSENFLSLRKDALESANRALELNQNDFQAYTQLGILHFQQGEYGSAEVYFRMCLDLDPWSIVSSKLTECIDLRREKESE